MAFTDRSFPNEYTQNVNFSSTGMDVSFGFNAALLRLSNRSAKSVYLTLGSTTGATTCHHELKSSEDVQWFDLGVGCAGLSFVATSSGGPLQIGAWG